LKVIPSKELGAEIVARIQAILSNSSTDNAEVRKVATETNALPLHYGLGGGMALRPTGDLLEFSWANPRDTKEVDDPRLMNIALFQGSKKYPELEALVPTKPSNATVCPYCKGTGYPTSALNSNIENIVCYCGGLGWIP
jgi:hypothetical protein